MTAAMALDRLARGAERALAGVAGAALFAMMALTFADVIGRYGFNHSIFGAAELVEFLMVVVIFAGVAVVTPADRHITASLFEDWLARRAPVLRRKISPRFSLAVYAVLAGELLAQGADSFAQGRRTSVLDLPQWIMPMSAGALSAAGALLLLAAIVREARSGRGRQAAL